MRLFADDSVIYRTINSHPDHMPSETTSQNLTYMGLQVADGLQDWEMLRDVYHKQNPL